MVALLPSYYCMMIFGKSKVGKVGTRGAQQIAKENMKTIIFYGIMMVVVNVIYFLIMRGASYQSSEICMVLLAILNYFGCFLFLFRYGTQKSKANGKGQIDLKDNFVIMRVKETIEWTMIAQILSLLSIYFWPVLFIGPIGFVRMLWKDIIKPCISAQDYSLQFQKWKELMESERNKESSTEN